MRTDAAPTNRPAVKPPAQVIASKDWTPISRSTAQTASVVASDDEDAEDRNDKERMVEEGGRESPLPGES
jgi:hypothetical protein